MPSSRHTSYALIGIGLTMAIAGGYQLSVLSGLAAQIIGLVGIGVLVLGGIWNDLLADSPTSWRAHAVSAIGALGLFVFIVFTGETPLTTRGEIAVSLTGLVLLVATAAYQRLRTPSQEYDERQLRIRYRAAYTAFWVVSVLLGVVVLLTAAISQPTDESNSILAVTLVTAAGIPLFTGGLAFKIAEGYYERQM